MVIITPYWNDFCFSIEFIVKMGWVIGQRGTTSDEARLIGSGYETQKSHPQEEEDTKSNKVNS